MTHRLVRTQIVLGELAHVFAFFKDPRNLEAITPPWLHFRMLEASDREVREGTRIAYRLRWQVFPMRWESRITEYEDNRRFADEMVRGPYRRWYHRHLFRAVPAGIEIRDEVEYELPFGPLGELAHAVAVRRQLDAIFAYRRERIVERFAGSTKTHCILLAHGSAEPAWRAPLERALRALTQRDGDGAASLAFLERAPPSLPEAMSTAVESGARRVLILPVFVAAGKHLHDDLPALLARARLQHPGLRVEVLEPVGEDGRFTELVVQVAREALSS